MTTTTSPAPAPSLDFDRKTRKPIILLGCPRSGTTLLGRILNHHSSVALMVEPRPIWMHGNAYRAEYTLGPEQLSPRIARYIDNAFARFLAERGRERFAEKTPSNCLRVPFIHALFPDCRIVHIIRDGRDVARSQIKKQEKPPKQKRVRQRFRETPFWEWPAYAPALMRMALRPLIMKKRPRYWGPKIPGWRDLIGKPHHIIAAHVWNETVGAARRDGRALPAENYIEIRYEQLMAEPDRVLREIEEFAELPHCEAMFEFTHGWIDPSRKGRWARTLTEEQAREMMDIMRPLLTELDYLDVQKEDEN